MRFLMCKPTYFGILYEINPWMNVSQKVDPMLALEQWEKLIAIMKQCGAMLEFVTPEKDWPDMVFTANAGLYYNQQIILSHFKYPERQGELAFFEKWFQKAGFHINQSSVSSAYFEGAGDALLCDKQLFVGYGFRSEKAFYALSSIFDGHKLVYCELINPYYYHLDTCFCPLNAESAIWFPAAFTKESQENMAKHINLLPVIEEEASNFACNAVVIKDHIIIPNHCPNLTYDLEQRGFNVHTCDMSEFIKAGGACKCLTLQLA